MHHLDQVSVFFVPLKQHVFLDLGKRLQELNVTIRCAEVSRTLGKAELWGDADPIMEIMMKKGGDSLYKTSISRSELRKRGAHLKDERKYPLNIWTNDSALTSLIEVTYKSAVELYMGVLVELHLDIHEKTFLELDFTTGEARKFFMHQRIPNLIPPHILKSGKIHMQIEGRKHATKK